MNHDHSEHDHSPGNRVFNWTLWGFIGIAAFFLITEHRAHLYGYLPFLLLAACPLMHLFMHRGHGSHGDHHHHHHQGDDPNQAPPPKESPRAGNRP